jgi:peptide/nickel transport system substrate-binding protein
MDTSSPLPRATTIDRVFGFIEALPSSDRFLLKTAIGIFFGALIWFGFTLNALFLYDIPSYGGTLREGIVGTPRFINPILAVTTADQDLSTLVYAGLMKLDANGNLVPSIAQSVTVSDDGLVYNVVLRDDVSFHDGVPLTTDDVVFTVERTQDPALKSPLRASWEGVAMEQISAHEMNFVLPEAYAPFIENLTLGILPKHIWGNATTEELPFSQYNSEPIGAGPYEVTDIKRNSSGIPASYELTAYDDYFAGTPKIKTLLLNFYPTEDALVGAFTRKEIESAGGLSPASLTRLADAGVPVSYMNTPLPRTFTIFFNQNETPVFRDAAARKALGIAVDRDNIVKQALGGYGIAITTPIPPGFSTVVEPSTASSTLDDARAALRDGGWRFNEESSLWEKTTDDGTLTLQFSISTSNAPVFQHTAELLKERWGELGVPVTIKQFEQSDLTQTVIRPRKYDALLFGTVVGRELDFFSFWHSSQRNDPGLNVALYANITTDALLSEARRTGSPEDRAEIHQKFVKEVQEEMPAIFLYVPTYTYASASKVQNVSLTGIARGSERLSTIDEWYIEKDSVWQFFTD